MTVFNKLLKNLKLSDEDEEMGYDDDTLYDDDDIEEPRNSRRESYGSSRSGRSSSREESQSFHDRSTRQASRSNERTGEATGRSARSTRSDRNPFSNRGNVVPLKNGRGKNNYEVHARKPKSFIDSAEIADLLLENHPVVVNFAGLDEMEAQRIIDFTCGCVHAINGDFRRMSEHIILFVPDNVDIESDFTINSDGMPTFINRPY